MITVAVVGVKEIDQVLLNLKPALSHAIMSTAHAAAAKPLVERMQLNAPEGPTGNLVDSIGITKFSLGKANELGRVRVGPRRKGKYKGFHGHMVEYGTDERELLGKGKYKRGTKRGKMTPDPFVKPAYEQTKGLVESRIAQETGRVVIRVMKKYTGKKV